MQKVRQGILQRKQVEDIGRNSTTQNLQPEKRQSAKVATLQNVAEHRRIVAEGTMEEKRQLQSETRSNLNLHVDARKQVLRDINNEKVMQDQQQLKHFKNNAQTLDDKQQIRKQYQMQIMEENRQLAQLKVQRQKNEKIQEWNQEVYAYNQRSQKNTMDYL